LNHFLCCFVDILNLIVLDICTDNLGSTKRLLDSRYTTLEDGSLVVLKWE